MVTIGIDQQLSNIALYKHRCPENIKKLYKSDGKCDNQQPYKAILEALMVYNLEIFTDNSTMSPCLDVTVKNASERNSLRLFTEAFDVKNKTAVLRAGASKSKLK